MGKRGYYGLGNIDLLNRPKVKNNGKSSTVRSMGIGMDGQEIVIPTVSDSGELLSELEAINQFKNTGKYLGKFGSIEEASRFGEQLHQEQEWLYQDKKDKLRRLLNFILTR